MTDRACPFLGLLDDADSMLAYPSVWNGCHRSRPPGAVNLKHQRESCLGGAYRECPVFLSQQAAPLPSHLRAPQSRARRGGAVSWRGIIIVLTLGFALLALGWGMISRLVSPLLFGTSTPSMTPSNTAIPTFTSSPTEPPTLTFTRTRTASPTLPPGGMTVTRTATRTATSAPTSTSTVTASPTITPTVAPVRTATPTVAPSRRQLDMPIGGDYKFAIHRVAGGESLDQYAKKYHTSVDAIQAVNYLLKTPLWVDALVIIPIDFTDASGLPRFEAYVVTGTGRTIEALALELGVDARALRYYNAAVFGEVLRVGDWLLIPRDGGGA